MNSTQLRYFVSLAEHGSFTGAAASCRISQSALSQQIKNLEKDLNIKLTVKCGRSFSLTPAGRQLFIKGRELLRQEEKLLDNITMIAENTGAAYRLGIPSFIDFNDTENRLGQKLTAATGMNLIVTKAHPNELYAKFTEGLLKSFIADESGVSRNTPYIKLPLLSLPLKVALHRRAFDAQTADPASLSELTVFYVCDKRHIEEEKRIISHLTGQNLKLLAVDSLKEGTEAAASERKGALLFCRSLLRRDEGDFSALQVLKLSADGKTIKRPLCCYLKEDSTDKLSKELIEIIRNLGIRKKKKHGRQCICLNGCTVGGKNTQSEISSVRSTGPAFSPDFLPI